MYMAATNKIEAIIPAHLADIVYNALRKIGIENVFINKGYSKGFFNDLRTVGSRGTRSYKVELLPATKIEVIVRSDEIENVVGTISKTAHIGISESTSVGKIMIYEIANIQNLARNVEGFDKKKPLEQNGQTRQLDT